MPCINHELILAGHMVCCCEGIYISAFAPFPRLISVLGVM